MILIKDDAHDLGYMSYKSRNSHKYNGEVQPDYHSNLNHWQVGSVLFLLSRFMALADSSSEVLEIADEMEENENELIDEGV